MYVICSKFQFFGQQGVFSGSVALSLCSMYTIALVQICSEINFVIENQMVYFMNHSMIESDCSHSYKNTFQLTTILDYIAITTCQAKVVLYHQYQCHLMYILHQYSQFTRSLDQLILLIELVSTNHVMIIVILSNFNSVCLSKFHVANFTTLNLVCLHTSYISWEHTLLTKKIELKLTVEQNDAVYLNTNPYLVSVIMTSSNKVFYKCPV